MEHKGNADINCNWYAQNDPQISVKGLEEL